MVSDPECAVCFQLYKRGSDGLFGLYRGIYPIVILLDLKLVVDVSVCQCVSHADSSTRLVIQPYKKTRWLLLFSVISR